MDTNQNLAGKVVPIYGIGILNQVRNVIRLTKTL